MVRHFLDLADFDGDTLRAILDEGTRLKGLRRGPRRRSRLPARCSQ